MLVGDYEGETIDFVAYDHYGTPKFSKHDRVILYIYQAEDGYVHHKYSYDALYPVKGDDYAVCGDPYSEYEVEDIEKNGRTDLDVFEFSPPIKFKISDHLRHEEDFEFMDQEDIREDFLYVMRKFSPPAFKIKGNRAICKMGMSAKKVADVRMEYEYITEREYDERRTKCWMQAGLPDEGANQKMREESGFNKCIGE